ncbi:hypothetical protein ScPMuIL_011653 [Solemya velum]
MAVNLKPLNRSSLPNENSLLIHYTDGTVQCAEAEEGLDEPDCSYGTPLKYDAAFNGPVKKRSCTDVVCCLLFLLFILGSIAVAYFAFIYGNPSLLIYPENSEGELCGYGKHQNEPYAFYFDLVDCGKIGPGVFVAGCPTPQICVEKCPDKNFRFTLQTQVDELLFCKPGIDKSTKTARELVEDEDCPFYYLESSPLLNRCVPKALSDVMEKGSNLVDNLKALDDGMTNFTNQKNQSMTIGDMTDGLDAYGLFLKAKEYTEKVVEDVVASWWMILVAFVLAMVISLVWIVLMRWLAGLMVWITLVAFLGIFSFSVYWCFTKYFETKDTDESFHFYLAVMRLSFKQSNFWLAFGIISAVVLVLAVLILLFLCQRIRIAIALIKEGSRAVGSILLTLIFPIIPYILQIGVVAYWGIVAVYLASTGREQSFDNNITFSNGSWDVDEIRRKTESLLDEIPCDTNGTAALSEVCGVIKYAKEGKYTLYLQLYNLFMLFWMVNFLVALGQMTLAGAFASYYWTFNKPKDIPSFPLLRSFGRCFRYHLGTLAFGSLIIAIVQLVRVLLEYVDHKLKATENPVGKFFLKCLKCCFWCLEQFLKFLNENAYIMTAIYGKNFCTSAKNAFMLIMRNVVRVVVVDKLTDFLLFIGKLVVVGAVGVASFFFFNGDIEFLREYKPSLNFYLVPVVLVILGSYIVASCFFSVYNMAVDTLFLCFLEDLERNDGSAEKPYFMSKELMKILGKKNKPPETDKDK